VARFEAEVRTAQEAGAGIVRTVMLDGRRYESFETAESFKQFADKAWQALVRAEPIVRKHRVRLAIENHKDWRVPELLGILKRMSSEYVGLCVDTGNSISLLEDPLEVIKAYAPFAFTTHLKDMGVQEYEDGFLLSEVPLGDGFLDLPRIVGLLEKANPDIPINLEMITRDPLKVPCLREKYWATLEDLPASELAKALALIREHASKKPLPRVTGLSSDEQVAFEEENVRRSFDYARKNLAL
jgi:sugar phosphate isomerase/epimerase